MGVKNYVFSFFGFIDLISILPFYIKQFVLLDGRFFRILRLFRLTRVFKLGRESKSLKLYLNSFNMQKMGNSLHSAINKFESTVQADIATCVGSAVTVHFHTMFDKGREKFPVSRKYITLEQVLDFENIVFDKYSEDPSILKIKADPKSEHRLTTNILRSNCRVTNQPDWGDVFIYTIGDYSVDTESLLQYLVSMRTETHFHEEIAECIYKRLIDIFPEQTDLGVLCLYTRRGGIDINPMRCSNYSIMENEFEKLRNLGFLFISFSVITQIIFYSMNYFITVASIHSPADFINLINQIFWHQVLIQYLPYSLLLQRDIQRLMEMHYNIDLYFDE